MKIDIHSSCFISTFAIQTWKWTDEFLTWNASEFYGVDKIILPASDIWLPDFVDRNSAGKFYNEEILKYFKVKLFNDGKVMFTPSGKVTTSCVLDMFYFPFDTQQCGIIVSSWMADCNEVNIISEFPEVYLG